MIPIAAQRSYRLGRFEIIAKPLEQNPYWTTHHIYLKGKLIGKQLSVPLEEDCEWYAAGATYADHSAPPHQVFCLRPRAKPGPGRPKKHEKREPESVSSALRKYLEALAQ